MMTKIKQEEYEVLKNLDDNWKWIARDEDNTLYTFEEEPRKDETHMIALWKSRGEISREEIFNLNLFQFIKWEDEEPHNIAELIEEYEKESEETEVKQNLIDEILSIEVTQFDGQKTDLEELVNPKQLEKVISGWMPESLQKWIKDNTFYNANVSKGGFIFVDDLREKLVPKQEQITLKQVINRLYELEQNNQSLWINRILHEFGRVFGVRKYQEGYEQGRVEGIAELNSDEAVTINYTPTIPQFVAEKIAKSKADGIYSLGVMFHSALHREFSEQVNTWIINNEKLFTEAWFAYPNIEVEKEQKYLVNILDEGTGAYLIYYPKSGNYGVTGILDDNKGITQFTEQEIKDYDERFWPFAVPVDEEDE